MCVCAAFLRRFRHVSIALFLHPDAAGRRSQRQTRTAPFTHSDYWLVGLQCRAWNMNAAWTRADQQDSDRLPAEDAVRHPAEGDAERAAPHLRGRVFARPFLRDPSSAFVPRIQLKWMYGCWCTRVLSSAACSPSAPCTTSSGTTTSTRPTTTRCCCSTRVRRRWPTSRSRCSTRSRTASSSSCSSWPT